MKFFSSIVIKDRPSAPCGDATAQIRLPDISYSYTFELTLNVSLTYWATLSAASNPRTTSMRLHSIDLGHFPSIIFNLPKGAADGENYEWDTRNFNPFAKAAECNMLTSWYAG